MSRHIIHQQAIEIDATDRNSAQPVFLEISRLFNNRAKDAAGYVLDKYDEESELIKIDVLEVDIGTIPFPFSEESFVKIYSEKLEEALAGAIKKQLQRAESKAQQHDQGGTKRTRLQLLEQFLLTGTMAWWAGKEELKDPVSIFKTLQEKEMPLLQAMILRLFPEGRVRKRLVYSFIEETVKTVVGIIQPSEKEFIIRYHARVAHLQTENRFVRTDNTGFRKALWLFILDFLADQSGSRFNRKMFVRSTLNAIAQRFNMRFEELLFFFSEALKDIPENFRRTENLLSLVEEIALEQSQQLHTDVAGPEDMEHHPENAGLLPEGQALFFFLLNGFLPIGFQHQDTAFLNAALIRAIQHHSAYARLFFLKHGSASLVRKRLISHFTEESVKAIIQLIQPSGLEMIASYVAFVRQFQKKTRFVQAEEQAFSQLLWDQVLTGLFSEIGTVFQAKSFLMMRLQALARHYAIDQMRLQAILVQETVHLESAAGSESGLFFLLAEILSEYSAAKQNEARPPELKTPAIDGTQAGQERFPEENITTTYNNVQGDPSDTSAPTHKQTGREQPSGKVLTLAEILEGSATAADSLQKSFVLHAVLYLLQSGKLPEWSGPGSLSVETVVRRMRASYPNELKTGLVYAVKTGKLGLYSLHRYAPLFKTDLIFLFENSFPGKLLLFFQELQKLHAIPDVLFAQGFIMALSASTDTRPELSVFFSCLLTQIEQAQGKEAAKAAAFKARTFTAIKESRILQQAFDKAVKEYAYSEMRPGMEYSAGNFRQALAISVSDGRIIAENELPDTIVTWIKHYATYKQLPSGIRPPDLLGEKRLLAWSLEFLFRSHKQVIQDLLADARFSAIGQVMFSELMQVADSGMQVRYFLEEKSRKLLLANDAVLATLNLDSPESWKWLVQKMTELPSDSPLQEKLNILMKQENNRALMGRYISNDELKHLFEKNNQSELWFWYRYFEEVSFAVTSGHFERQQFRLKIIGFFLSLLTGQMSVQRTAKALSMHFVAFFLAKRGDALIEAQGRIVNLKAVKSPALSARAGELMKYLSADMKQALLRTRAGIAVEEEIRAMEKALYFNPDDTEKKRLEEERRKNSREATEPQKDKALAFSEQIYIRNAGMILLHPFLATLFARAGLISEGVFTGEAAQAKAVRLLQYAVTGTEQSPEYELVLNKLLSGLKPEDVLSDTPDLETEEKELVTGMIHAIMMQWDKMKNTSLEGFRNSFLMREGYVFQTEESWVLRVEQRGYDVILQTLPWSFGMLKFSWMSKPLIVEWN